MGLEDTISLPRRWVNSASPRSYGPRTPQRKHSFLWVSYAIGGGPGYAHFREPDGRFSRHFVRFSRHFVNNTVIQYQVLL